MADNQAEQDKIAFWDWWALHGPKSLHGYQDSELFSLSHIFEKCWMAALEHDRKGAK
jgi:hypothetical protein